MKSELINRVKESLRNTDQKLVFLDSKICPIRTIVGRSKRDSLMRSVAKRLEKDGVIEYYTGFTSLAEYPPFTYVTSMVLTDDFFELNCSAGKQLKMF